MTYEFLLKIFCIFFFFHCDCTIIIASRDINFLMNIFFFSFENLGYVSIYVDLPVILANGIPGSECFSFDLCFFFLLLGFRFLLRTKFDD